MKIYLLTIAIVFGLAQSQENCYKSGIKNANLQKAQNSMPTNTPAIIKFDKLPDGAILTDEVREESTDKNGETTYKIITVEGKLRNIGAKYKNDVLVDSKDKEIRFYKPPIRGASQGFEEDQRQRKLDAEELKNLKEKFTVIILYYDPRKVM